MPIDLRCLKCRSEFDSSAHTGLSACPACGNRGVPADPREDQDWTLSVWAWRILATATLAYAHAIVAGDQPGNDSVGTAIALWQLVVGGTPDDGAVGGIAEDYVRNAELVEPRVVRCSPHEIRVLTFWASGFVKQSREGDGVISDSDVEPIFAALRKQSKGPVALTFEDEIDDLRAGLAEQGQSSEVHVRYGGGGSC